MLIWLTIGKTYDWLTVGNNPLLELWFFFGTPFSLFGTLRFYMLFVLYLGPRLIKKYGVEWEVYIEFKKGQHCEILILFRVWPLTTDNFTTFCLNFIWTTNLSAVKIDLYKFEARYEVTKNFWNATMLRKKQSHITFHLVCHQAAVVGITWVIGKYFPDPELSIVALCNTAVHMCMY